MKEKLRQLKSIQNMMVLALLALLFVLTTQTSAIGQTLCDGRVPTIVGTEGPDEINGTEGPDVIHGLGGVDYIKGMGGDDVICGGGGSDVIGGDSGNDIVFGGPGHDAIWGGDGDDILRGGDGNDSIFGGKSGNDRLYGDSGNDSLYGKSGVDELYGGGGVENNDSCYDVASTFISGCEQFNGENIPPAPVPKTGQITSHEPGDDGDLQKGVPWPVPRFTDNGDGTVTDNLTGLIWLKNATCFGEMNWDDALEASNNLEDGQCGLSDASAPGDWHLPNVNELHSLVDWSQHSPSLPLGYPFINVNPYAMVHWTSTSYADPICPYCRWYVHMDEGVVGYFSKDKTTFVWPVRDGN